MAPSLPHPLPIQLFPVVLKLFAVAASWLMFSLLPGFHMGSLLPEKALPLVIFHTPHKVSLPDADLKPPGLAAASGVSHHLMLPFIRPLATLLAPSSAFAHKLVSSFMTATMPA